MPNENSPWQKPLDTPTHEQVQKEEGLSEQRRITKQYGRQLLSTFHKGGPKEFSTELGCLFRGAVIAAMFVCEPGKEREMFAGIQSVLALNEDLVALTEKENKNGK